MTADTTSDWVEGWRASRGSPPDLPTTAAFDVLAAMPSDVLNAAATATGDDVEQVRWWKELAGDPARKWLVAIKMSLVPIYRALRDVGPMTDDELTSHLEKKKSSIGPRRVELQREGLVQEVDKKTTASGRQSAVWGLVPAGEVEQAREKAIAKGPRKMHLDKYTIEEQVHIVKYLVSKDEVNALLSADRTRSKAADRARKEAGFVHAQRDRARREYNERVKQAERDASPQLVFLKALGQLRRAGDAVREIERVIDENINSQMLFGSADIGPDSWPEVREAIGDLLKTASAADERLRRLLDGDGVIEVEGWEVDDDLELEGG